MTPIVVDASVAAKWFLPAANEPLSREARLLFEGWRAGQVEFVVPDLFWVELGAALWKAVRRNQTSAGSAQEALRALRSSPPSTKPSEPLIERALEIAVAYERSVYDSLYVALALHTKGMLVTADERLANALAGRFPVRWLGIFSIT